MAGGCGTTGGWAVRSRALPGERDWLLPLGSADGRSDGMSVRSDRTGATSGGNGRSLLLGRLYRRGSTITTVSYTHLRAHETPEHLVCRLLLEKKKKTKNK